MKPADWLTRTSLIFQVGDKVMYRHEGRLMETEVRSPPRLLPYWIPMVQLGDVDGWVPVVHLEKTHE